MQANQYGKLLSTESRPFFNQEPNQSPNNEVNKQPEETKGTSEKKKLKLSAKEFSATTLNNSLSFFPISSQKKQQYPQSQQQSVQQPLTGEQKNKKKKKKSKKTSEAKKEDDTLWKSIPKVLDNQWTKPIYTKHKDKKSQPQKNPTNAHPQDVLSEEKKVAVPENKKNKELKGEDPNALHNSPNLNTKMYKIPKIELENVAKLYTKLKKLQNEHPKEDEAQKWKIKQKLLAKKKKLSKLKKSMKFLDEKLLDKKEAEKRKENEQKIKEEALKDDQNLESEYMTIEEYNSSGELLKTIDEKTRKVTKFRGGVPISSTNKQPSKQSPFSPTESDESDSNPSPKKETPSPESEIGRNIHHIIDEETKSRPPESSSAMAEGKKVLTKEKQFSISSEVVKHKEQSDQGKIIRPEYYYSLKIREWVDHIPSLDIDEVVMRIINKLVVMEMQKKIRQPQKFKRRIACGFREVLKSLDSNIKDRMSKCVIFSLNIKENPYEFGTDEIVFKIIDLCKKRNVTVIHACTRKALGMAFRGHIGPRISAVSLLNYHGAGVEELFSELIKKVEQNRIEFKLRYG